MKADLVSLGRSEAAALLRADMHDHGAAQLEGLLEGREERLQVVPGDEADVGDPEILEQPPRLREVHDGCPESLAELADRRSDPRQSADELVIGVPARLPRSRELDLAQVLRKAADRGADRHLVVVENDQELGLPLADVVERLEAQAARDRGIADDDRNSLRAVTQVARRSEPLPDRQARSGVAAVEDVVLRLGPSREAADAAQLAKGVKSVVATGQQLVGIRLVAGVPDDPIAGRFEEPVQGDRELDDAEAASQMATSRRDGRDDDIADLSGELVQLGGGQIAEVGRAAERGKDRGHHQVGVLQRLVRRHGRLSDGRASVTAALGPRLSTCSFGRARSAERPSGLGCLVVAPKVTDVKPAAGLGDQLLDAELRFGQQTLAVALERDRTLRSSDRVLEGQAAGLELGDDRPELGEGVVE